MSKFNRSKMRLVAPSVEPATPDRTPVAYALRDLAVAPENLRFAEPADDGIGELAETIFAAGVLQPLTVRPGRGEERAGMVLDGRRRLLALGVLCEAGRIADDYPVSCFVETDVARQAAAVVLTNTAVPVHLADVIVAIGKMLKARLTIPAISGALGYGEIEVRRLAALSELHPKALEALKAGRCSLRQAKLLARLPDRDAQGEIAEAALNGFGFQEWRVAERLDAGQVTIHDRRFAFVGPERYAAAGGRLESDLFGERADVVLDPDRLQAAWTARAEAIARGLADGRGWQVHVTVDEFDVEDEGLEPFGDGYGMELEGEEREAWRTAAAAARAARDALAARDLVEADCDADIAAYLAARLAEDQAEAPTREVRLVAVFADATTGLDVRAWGPPAPVVETDEEQPAPTDDDEDADGPPRPAPRLFAVTAAPVAVAPVVEVEGVNHGLHELRTDVATRALIRALADDPVASLVAVVARLFCVLVLHQGVGRGGAGALSLAAEAYSRARTPAIPELDGEVRRRLADRREAWVASGLSPIAWVAALDAETRMALLAELAALSLDLREERTTSVRRGARAEAVEIAALCHADVTRHWTPDAMFLAAHPKAKLLAMLAEMGAEAPLAAGARKDELVALVAERAAERRWAPAYLSWAAEPPQAGDDDEPPPDAPDGSPDAEAAGQPEVEPSASDDAAPRAA
ncbi:ParB/RepB/Spo0J family partition protein [Phenylobacterium kunshanense]|uniref:Chromosome partitioning protein ParB n=1 Tax=Phenylobacterium kunshanense TaxID=1445034 RepID=A0A328BLH1_9CAUL|nr:ParB/RepB/Spo0J family partition protein [Phenylobacterium kunshanense]RAK67797.1 chromosome partitioning protein ParB [Phenylobacterium kunshanense]